MVLLFVCALLWFPVLLGAQPAVPSQRVGAYEVSLRLPPDGLFAQEEIEVAFRVMVAGLAGELTPLNLARPRCTVFMPSMPGMARFEEVAHSHGVAGDYGVHPAFPHGGEYRLRVTVPPPVTADPPPPGLPLTVEFPLEVKDADPDRQSTPRHPFQLQLTTSPAKPKAGEPVELALSVRLVNTADGRAAREFESVHERLMHLFVVRTDFSHFAHEHPELAADGTFRLRHTFPAGGVYRVFADVAPKGAGSQVLRADLTVDGEGGPTWDLYGASTGDRGLWQKVDDLTLAWTLPSGVLPSRKTVVLTASLRDVGGRPVTSLQPYLGAMGHLLLIGQDTETFVHSHPDDRTPAAPGTIPFLARFPKPGLYRGWMQFKRNNEVKTAAFIVQAE